MSTVQVWLLIAVPALALAGAMFVRRSSVMSNLGYLTLLAGFGGMAVYDRVSAGAFGAVIALLFAAGRGSALEQRDLRRNEEGVPDAALHPSRRSA